jgi:NitT/TauT family transport system permease protein
VRVATPTGLGVRSGARRARVARLPHARRGSLWADAALLLAVATLFAGLVSLGREWASPIQTATEIDLSLTALPAYALLSLSRGCAAYLLSLLFTIVYGGAAARSRRAERVLIPLLDVLQGIPVLSFLPGLVLGLVGLFPRSNIGLELVCIIAIFTGQVWNMTFSFYASVRAIPTELSEAARLFRLGPWMRLTRLELPCAMTGLLWNSMMSMAGGWFFLTVVEAFTLRGKSYRLPGIGSYMSAAVEAGDARAMAAACAAMVIVIVAVDVVVWKPLIAWGDRFKLGDAAHAEAPRSFVYDLVRRSRLAAWIRSRADRARRGSGRRPPRPSPRRNPPSRDRPPGAKTPLSRAAGIVALAAAMALAGWGAHRLATLLAKLGPESWIEILASIGWTGLRVLAVLALGAAWAAPIGILIGRSAALSRALEPLVQLLASFPMPMLFPIIAPRLVAAGWSFGIVAAILMMAGTHWYILFNVLGGAAAVPEDLREVARVFRIGELDRFRLVDLPGTFPFLLTGLITAAGGAWNASIVSEWVPYGAGKILVAPGIGSLISRAFNEGDDALLAGGVLLLSLCLVSLNRFLWKPLYAFADRRFALNR